MDQTQLADIANQVTALFHQKYPHLYIEVHFWPIAGRSHTFTRQVTIHDMQQNCRDTFEFDDVYAPPKTPSAILAMQMEVLLQSTLQQFHDQQRARLRRLTLKAG